VNLCVHELDGKSIAWGLHAGQPRVFTKIKFLCVRQSTTVLDERGILCVRQSTTVLDERGTT